MNISVTFIHPDRSPKELTVRPSRWLPTAIMREDSLVYERNVTDPRSWREFTVEHIAFGLHRITGWLLLGWITVHLAIPALGSASDVWIPTSIAVIVGLLSVFLFHALNGIRLLVAELTGFGTARARWVFRGTLAICAVLVVTLGGLL